MSFCLFGVVGDCRSDTRSITMLKQQTESSVKILNEIVNKVMVDMKASSVQMNRIVCRTGRDCIIENVSMKQVAEVSLKGQGDLQSSLRSDLVISQLVDSAAKIARDITNKNTGAPQNTFTKTQQEAVTYLKTEITSKVTQETFASCVASVIQSNSIDVEAQGGAIIKGIIMEQVATVLADCVFKVFNGIVQTIQNNNDIKHRLEEESKIYNKGFLDDHLYLIIGGAAVLLIALIIYKNSGKKD